MFHHRLIELEAELAAKEQSKVLIDAFPPECTGILDFIQREIEVVLGDKVPRDWVGWICYKRNKQSLIILRGRAFKEGRFGEYRAGIDVKMGLDSISEYRRGFDISPPQDLDHLLLNFGQDGDRYRVFLWYGENIAPYKLVFAADVADDPHRQLSEAIVECCFWIAKRPKQQTLKDYLREQKK